MSIEKARPFDPNNRPLKGEWVHVSGDSETATMPARELEVDSSLTQGHDVVQRQPQAKKFPVIWAVIALIVLLAVIGFALNQGQTGTKSSPSVSSSSTEISNVEPVSSVGDSAAENSSPNASDSVNPSGKGQKEGNPSGSN